MTRPSRDKESTCAEIRIVWALFPCVCSVLLEKKESDPDPFRYWRAHQTSIPVCRTLGLLDETQIKVKEEGGKAPGSLQD
ncbi:transcription elongation factor A protein-like 8 isoform X2 [Fukomys damarensis]|uniref:transcription elongation factor A protein-like 8 isoform X2 n=1 Tax=Fukomys damarensis TaxID=885580 RepID=UPI0014559020|nr:transcription elongation factor A protein-like 8 isoform X2 [Fukomys damarensis]